MWTKCGQNPFLLTAFYELSHIIGLIIHEEEPFWGILVRDDFGSFWVLDWFCAGSAWDGSVFASTIVSKPQFLVIFESVTTFGWGRNWVGPVKNVLAWKLSLVVGNYFIRYEDIYFSNLTKNVEQCTDTFF